MDTLKRFVDCAVPVLTCNLRCPYCYIAQERKFLTDLPKFKYSAETIGRAFAPERWCGGREERLHINICGGGETLLPPEMTDILREILKQGHYVTVVTNGTITKRFQEICRFPEEFRKRLLFKFSFHYLELARMEMIDRFFENIEMVKKAGCSFSVELTPADYYIPHIDEIKSVCMERLGALCHVTVARKETAPNLPILTELSRDEYLKTWGSFDSDLFRFKMQTFYVKRKEFCYAGNWTSYLHLGTGVLKQCYYGAALQNIFENPDSPIRWEAIGANCPEPHCHNAHVWMTLGALPSADTPTYASMRDRVTLSGEHWLQPEMRAFLSGKLKESNLEYDAKTQREVNRKEFFKVRIAYHVRTLAKKAFYLLPENMYLEILRRLRHNKNNRNARN